MAIIGQKDTSPKSRPSLSACMIVKNEEKFLPQCLKSIKDAVDEIIIVDTGSTDRTVEIAHSFGAKVYHHPWKNSFSEARNHSLHYATCDWVLQIDADETLELEDVPLLHDIISTCPYDAILVAIYSELPGCVSKHYFTRIFRRGKARYEGIVHNQLVFEGEVLPSEIKLRHYGYNLSEEDMKKKYKRTGDLLRQQLAENPKNIFALANLIRNYRNELDYEQVIAHGEKALATFGGQTEQHVRNQMQRIYVDYAYGLIRTQRWDKAEEICKTALKDNVDFLDVLFLMGGIYLEKRQFGDALNYFRKYLIAKEKDSKQPSANLLIVDTYDSEHRAYNNIGECYKNLGMPNEAEVAYKKALEIKNNEPLYCSNLVQLYISQNKLADAENTAVSLVKQGAANNLTLLLLGQVQIMREKPLEAIDTFQQLIQRDEKNVNACVLLANLLIQTNRTKEAESIIKRYHSLFPGHLGMQCLLERIKYLHGDKEGVKGFIKSQKESNPSDKGVFLELGDFCIEVEEYSTAIEFFEKYLKTSPPDAKVVANIALCYARLGKMEAAMLGFQTALQIDPACHSALKNLAVLKKNLAKKP